ncbi:hypothetical protein JNG87_20050 [Chryseobacterium cucumeris]|nr:hypothetical protein JNG87_20050 [Chryseobacterium cucumeris]
MKIIIDHKKSTEKNSVLFFLSVMSMTAAFVMMPSIVINIHFLYLSWRVVPRASAIIPFCMARRHSPSMVLMYHT